MSEELTDLDRQLEQLDVLGLKRDIVLGIEMQAWLGSPVGKAIVDRAKREQVQAMVAFAEVDPADPKAVMRAQMDWRVPAALIEWIADAIAEGQAAETRAIEADQSRT